MSTETIHGKIDEVTGKLKQAVGEATHNDKVANEGVGQQIKGHVEQAWGSVKDAVKETHEKHKPELEQHAHDIREKLTSTAQNAKEHIQHLVDPNNKNA
jgi:uncharacterized protein YjbJ (UPF0337 family)